MRSDLDDGRIAFFELGRQMRPSHRPNHLFRVRKGSDHGSGRTNFFISDSGSHESILQANQQISAVDLRSGANQNFGNTTGTFGVEGGFHLHGLQDKQFLPWAY